MGIFAVILVLGVLAVVGVTGGMIWGIRHPSLPSGETASAKKIGGGSGQPTRVISGRKEQKRLMGENGFSYLDVESGATGDDIVTTLEPFADDEVIGNNVRCVVTGIGRAEFARDGIVRLMEREFGRDSLTWEKFSVPVEAAMGDIYASSAKVANIVQTFDSNEYQRLVRLDKAGQLSEGSQEANRLSVMREMLRTTTDLMYANEATIEEMNRLQTELARLSDSHQAVTSDEIAEELRNLADDTKKYMPDDPSAGFVGDLGSVPANPVTVTDDEANEPPSGADSLADAHEATDESFDGFELDI